jgi:hypothetical protein
MNRFKLSTLSSIVLIFLFFLACPPEPIPPPDDPSQPPVEYVWHDICKDSGKFKSEFCPPDRIERKRFVKGDSSIPTEWCDFHVAPIPVPARPFLGASYYQLITASKEDIRWFISQLRAHGANATEIFLVFSWSNGWKHSPFKQIGTWTEPERYGDFEFPTFDLDQWNPETWDKLRLIMELCRDNGIALFMRIQDYCSVKDPKSKRQYAFNNGSNAQVYTGGLWGDPIRAWYHKLNQRLITLISVVGLEHYFIQPMNEADVLGDDWPGGEAEKDEVCKSFHQFYIDDLGIAENRIILNIFRDNIRRHFEGLGYRIEWHGIASAVSLQECFNINGAMVFPNGDGATDGNGLSSHGYLEPSFSQAEQMGSLLVLNNWFGYAYFLRSTETSEIANIRNAIFRALDGLVSGASIH